MQRRALHYAIVWLVLFGFWVVLSGHLDPVHLGMGVVCAAGITALSGGLLYTHVDGAPDRYLTQLPWLRILAYLPWIGWEIVKANIAVLKLVLGPMSKVRPRVVTFRTGLSSEVSRVTLANSITLTPGTVTLDIDGNGEYVIHAIDGPSADGLLEGSMQRKVAHTFHEVHEDAR